jgi:hypothetical protein
MATSKWTRWRKPFAVVFGLFCLGNAVYWIWRLVVEGASLPVVFPLVTWLLLTAGMIVLYFRDPKADEWPENPVVDELESGQAGGERPG